MNGQARQSPPGIFHHLNQADPQLLLQDPVHLHHLLGREGWNRDCGFRKVDHGTPGSSKKKVIHNALQTPGTKQVSRGRFVWYDLMTPDPDSATEFYTKVAG
jgi:DUF1365 family protein